MDTTVASEVGNQPCETVLVVCTVCQDVPPILRMNWNWPQLWKRKRRGKVVLDLDVQFYSAELYSAARCR